MIGCEKDVAERFFNQYEAQGWTLGNRQPMMNWGAKLCMWRDDARTMPESAPKTPSNSPSEASRLYALREQQQGLEEQIRELENIHSYEHATGRSWNSNDKRVEWLALRKELRELKKQRASKK